MKSMLQEIREKYVSPQDMDRKDPTQELEWVTKAMRGLLPIEGEMRMAFQKRAEDLRVASEEPFDSKYPRIDLRFLTRRRRQKWFGWERSVPAFACFDPGEDGLCRIRGRRNDRSPFSSERHVTADIIPTAVTEFYYDAAVNLLRSREENVIFAEICCRFAGSIPPKARKEINRARDEFEGRVLLICEAPKWKLDKEIMEQPRDPDPLIVGHKDGVTWLVGAFDLTDVESAIKAEFSWRE